MFTLLVKKPVLNMRIIRGKDVAKYFISTYIYEGTGKNRYKFDKYTHIFEKYMNNKNGFT